MSNESNSGVGSGAEATPDRRGVTSDETSEIRPGPPPMPGDVAQHTAPLPAVAPHPRPASHVALVFVAVAAAGVQALGLALLFKAHIAAPRERR